MLNCKGQRDGEGVSDRQGEAFEDYQGSLSSPIGTFKSQETVASLEDLELMRLNRYHQSQNHQQTKEAVMKWFQQGKIVLGYPEQLVSEYTNRQRQIISNKTPSNKCVKASLIERRGRKNLLMRGVTMV